jgi:hypothetical protein
VFTGPNPPDAALITYYQSKRHIFGKMKLEILDSQGKVVDTLPPNSRRGISRVEWPMRLKAPHVPPAATAAFEAAQGPRVLPGTYTVKMTRGKETYTTQLDVVLDPRAKFTLEDRKMEFDAAMRLHRLLGDMSFDVDRINGVHDALLERSGKAKGDSTLGKRLQELAEKVEAMRKKIVTTTEGGALMGEERIREKTTGLYGAILNYEGRPTDYQTGRIDSLKKELEDVAGEFEAFVTKELPAVNKSLSQKKLEPIQPSTEKCGTPPMPIRVLPGSVATGIFGGVSGTELRARWETDFCAGWHSATWWPSLESVAPENVIAGKKLKNQQYPVRSSVTGS